MIITNCQVTNSSLGVFSRCVFVFVFVFVFLLFTPYLVITLIKCLKGHMSLGSLCWCVFKKVFYSLTQLVSE